MSEIHIADLTESMHVRRMTEKSSGEKKSNLFRLVRFEAADNLKRGKTEMGLGTG